MEIRGYIRSGMAKTAQLLTQSHPIWPDATGIPSEYYSCFPGQAFSRLMPVKPDACNAGFELGARLYNVFSKLIIYSTKNILVTLPKNAVSTIFGPASNTAL